MDPWQAFDALDDREQERVRERIRSRRLGARTEMRGVSDDELQELDELLTLVEQERKRRALADLLRTFLPPQG